MKYYKGRVLNGTHQTHRLAVVAVVVVVSVEVRIVEVHVPRVVAIVVRRRPVVAVGTDIVHRSPIPVTRGRQEHVHDGVGDCLSRHVKRTVFRSQ